MTITKHNNYSISGCLLAEEIALTGVSYFRFCYEVAELSWWERKMAATLFADPPQATMEEARDHFIKVSLQN